MSASLFKPKSEPIKLRPYQMAAVEAIYQSLRMRDDNPCCVLPTAAGKTPVIATICGDAVERWKGRVLILAHVKELLVQATEKLSAICPNVDIGLYSAGLKKRETQKPVIVAGIQSVYKRADELGRFDLIIVDECNLIPADGEGMYRTFLEDSKIINPKVRLIGMTATPYRMRSGMICSEENLLNHICYEVGVKELIVQGYISKLLTKAGKRKADLTGVEIHGGEFVLHQLEKAMDKDSLVDSAVTEIIEETKERKSCLIFCSGVKHAEHVHEVIEKITGEKAGLITEQTNSLFRQNQLENFKQSKLKFLVNVNVLTIGFDAPNIDCVAMLRPTHSPGLYYQMVGRGFRIWPGKENCLVLDFADNIMRHGPIDEIDGSIDPKTGGAAGVAPAKTCPNCRAVIAVGYTICPQCGEKLPRDDKAKHNANASNNPILSQGEPVVAERGVTRYMAFEHTKRGTENDPEHPKTCRVDYQIGWQEKVSEWLCFEHEGFAYQKAVSWWMKRSNAPIPVTAAQAADLINNFDAVAKTISITTSKLPGEKFDSIVGYKLGDIPKWTDEDEKTFEKLTIAPKVKNQGNTIDWDEETIPF